MRTSKTRDFRWSLKLERRRAFLIKKEYRLAIKNKISMNQESLSPNEVEELAKLQEISRKHYGV